MEGAGFLGDPEETVFGVPIIRRRFAAFWRLAVFANVNRVL